MGRRRRREDGWVDRRCPYPVLTRSAHRSRRSSERGGGRGRCVGLIWMSGWLEWEAGRLCLRSTRRRVLALSVVCGLSLMVVVGG